MMQLPHRVRLELSKLAKTESIKAMLAMPDDQLQPILDEQANKLKVSDRVALAYQLVAPLMLENKAILTFLENPQNSHLSAALPDVATPDEALLLAQKEYRLSQEEVAELKPLLQRLKN